MAVNKKTIAILAADRAAMKALTDAQILAIVIGWTQAWDKLKPEYDMAIAELLAQAKDGRVGAAQVRKSSRLRQALESTKEQLEALAELTNKTITVDLPDAISAGGTTQVDAIRSQLPANKTALVAGWDRVSGEALAAIVERTAERIHKSTNTLLDDVERLMKRELVRGIATGTNPKETARRIVKGAEGRFNGGLTRAMTIARTETLSAHREASLQSALASKDVLANWRWSCALSGRTCPACLAMNGQTFPTETTGPDGHQNCRCARVDITKSWAELGFTGITEPDDIFPDAQAWYENLTPDSQTKIMGKTRRDLLVKDEIEWSDLAKRQDNPGWRQSYVVTPLKDLKPS
ncbi:phage minor head protein [Arthrobacter cryoconiti]|uniref:Phage minor head protein n=1 Tax=Arthrobacter cryoconiti TaxID=748907 RepID=A0ABV8QZT6_9MICC|nr:phage minor head protein [Arthrobacter cryoconiti]MCC9068806.1 phage head morphogenesis protein [Arthrobacter cryoconiti]